MLFHVTVILRGVPEHNEVAYAMYLYILLLYILLFFVLLLYRTVNKVVRVNR